MTWRCRGCSCGSIAASRDPVAAAVLELDDERVGASSALSARLPAPPVTSEGRVASLPIRLDVAVTTVSSDFESDDSFRICAGPPWSRVAAQPRGVDSSAPVELTGRGFRPRAVSRAT